MKKLTLESELLVDVTDLGQDTDLEATHREEELRIVLGVDRYESIVPLDGRKRTRKSVLDVPEDGATQIDVVLDQTHPAVSRPTLLVVVTDQVLVVRIGVGREVSLDEIARLFGRESEHDVDPVDVTRVESDRMSDLGRRIAELEEIVRHLRRTRHFTRSRETEDEEIEDETIVLKTMIQVRRVAGATEEENDSLGR